MKDLTIIIPIHKFDENIKNMFTNAYESIINMKDIDWTDIMIVGPKNVLTECKNVTDNIPLSYANGKLIYEENDKTDFCSQVNHAVGKCATKYFSILEFDDAFKERWISNVEYYLESYNDMSVFLPIAELQDAEGNVMSFINEAAWASSFSNELGVLDLDCLQAYMDFNVTGGVIKTEDFIEIGGLKPSLKIAAWYEFLMRLCHNGKKIMVIPKIGYLHVIGRPDSFMDVAQKTIAPEEGEWLIKTAQQEYFYKEDRNKVFNK